MVHRGQRLSATRAAHRVLRRVGEAEAHANELVRQAHANTEAALSARPSSDRYDEEYFSRFDRDPAYIEAQKLFTFGGRIGWWGNFWRLTTIKGRLYLHPPDVPVQVWAVTIDRSGVHWFDVEIVRITARNVMVRYAGEIARLDRYRLWGSWAFWRAVRFVSSRTGRIAAGLDEIWWSRCGQRASAPPLGTSAPPRKPPVYAPSGVTLVYRRGGGSCRPSLGMIRQLPGR
jgi:hypothetical protein